MSGSTVVLTWTAPASGDAPTSYVVEAGSASRHADVVNADIGSSTQTITATNVTPGIYFVRVRARNASGTSAPSNEVAVTVAGVCSRTPSAPTSLTASVNGSSVTFAWQAPTTGCAPTSYVLEAGGTFGLSNLASFSTGSAATTYAAAGVPVGSYYVRVKSQNSGGTSGASNEVVVAVDVGGCTTPSAPADLVARVSGTAVTLSWSAAAGSPSSYLIEAGSSSGSSEIVVSDTGNLATSLTASAAPGTYFVRVRARNGCGTSVPSNEVVIVPTQAPSCVTIVPSSQDIGGSATVGSVSVLAPSSCTWTATSNDSFITITSGHTGAGSGTVSYSVPSSIVRRTGTLTIGNQTFTVFQENCFGVNLTAPGVSIGNPTPPTLFPTTGGTVTFAVRAGNSCEWTAQSDASFVRILSGSSGRGSYGLVVDVQPNAGVVRAGTITVRQGSRAATATIVQDGPAGAAMCVSSLTSGGQESVTVPADSYGDGDSTFVPIDVSAPSDCAWIATWAADWMSTWSSPFGQPTTIYKQFVIGLGSSRFRVGATSFNPLDVIRSGFVTAGGRVFTLNQAACRYSVFPTSIDVLASGGTAVIMVTPVFCQTSWAASSNADFMTFSSASSGVGRGSVSVSVAPNSGPARSGTLTIAGRTVTVTQRAQ